ncbi:MAG: tellurite resistance protein permease [Candidatus Hydrogenedentota bacterium]
MTATERSSEHGAAPIEQVAALVRSLHPAYFAMVMATGIVAIAAHFTGFERCAWVLGGGNYVFAAVLCILYTARVAYFPRAILGDLQDPRRAVGFMTLVAGTCILGNQTLIIFGSHSIAMVFLAAGAVLWCALLYAVLGFLTLSPNKPDIAHSIHGGWLVLVVATQAVAILAALLADDFATWSEFVLFVALNLWLAAGMLYIWLISLIFYRYSFFPMAREDVLPPYWINMGAMAISTLGGCVLLAAADRSPLLAGLREFITGATLVFWATATWWIPFLIVLGVWRHVAQRVPIVYDPAYWSMVFPLGMYTACSWRLSALIPVPHLDAIPTVTIYAAFLAWGAAFLGVLNRMRAIGAVFCGQTPSRAP